MEAVARYAVCMLMNGPEPIHRKKLKRIEGANHARALNWSCYRNQPFLASDRARTWLVEAIDFARTKHGFDLWAWCIMPTHVHLLIFPKPAEHACSTSKHATHEAAAPVRAILSTIKQSVAKRAAHWAPQHAPDLLSRMRIESPSGAVTHRFWQRGGGYDRNLFEPHSIHEMISYIHQNPVEAGLCARAADWLWSSAASHEDRSKGLLALNLESMPPITVRPGDMLAR